MSWMFNRAFVDYLWIGRQKTAFHTARNTLVRRKMLSQIYMSLDQKGALKKSVLLRKYAVK